MVIRFLWPQFFLCIIYVLQKKIVHIKHIYEKKNDVCRVKDWSAEGKHFGGEKIMGTLLAGFNGFDTHRWNNSKCTIFANVKNALKRSETENKAYIGGIPS